MGHFKNEKPFENVTRTLERRRWAVSIFSSISSDFAAAASSASANDFSTAVSPGRVFDKSLLAGDFSLLLLSSLGRAKEILGSDFPLLLSSLGRFRLALDSLEMLSSD